MPKSTRGTPLRPEIQALRAVAVAAVVLFHLWPNRLTGGYVGVDVFFAISGFLITAHLLREVSATGRIGFAAFWARRARRLLPASLLVLAVSAAGTYLFVAEQKWQQFFGEIGASALYVQNWLLAHNAVDYLASDNDPSVAQHFWTLSAEEQYYVVWPLLIGAVLLLTRRRTARLRRGALLAVLVLLTAASLAYSIAETHSNPSVAYFITPTRIWEFGLGAIVAFLWPEPAGGVRLRAAMSWLGLGGIAVACVFFDAATVFPGYAAALPVVGALLVIVAGPVAHPAGTAWLARLRPVQFLGDISYSVYLWHWPLIVLAPYMLGHDTARTARLTILVASILLAWGTKVFVEDPVRFSPRFLGRRRPRTVFAWSVAAMAIVIAISGTGWDRVAKREKASEHAVAQALENKPDCLGGQAIAKDKCGSPDLPELVPDPAVAADDGPTRKDCWSEVTDPKLHRCTFGDTTKPRRRIALIGDSHARQYYEPVKAIAKKRHWQVDMMGKGRCAWSAATRDNEPEMRSSCMAWKQRVNDYLAKAKPYDAIITSYQSGPAMKPRPGKSEHETEVQGFVDVWRKVTKKGTRIIAMKDTPEPSKDVLSCVEKYRRQANKHCSVDRDEALPFDGQVKAVREVRRSRLVTVTDLLCTRTKCHPVIGDVVVYRSGGHLTDTYMLTLTPYLRKKLVKAIGHHRAAATADPSL